MYQQNRGKFLMLSVISWTLLKLLGNLFFWCFLWNVFKSQQTVSQAKLRQSRESRKTYYIYTQNWLRTYCEWLKSTRTLKWNWDKISKESRRCIDVLETKKPSCLDCLTSDSNWDSSQCKFYYLDTDNSVAPKCLVQASQTALCQLFWVKI